MTVDLVVRGARVLTSQFTVEGAGVAVQDGKIVALAKDPRLPEASQVVDADGKILMPGAIDAHAHIYDPDYTHREDWRSGSEAAAAGGVTLLIDMPLVLTVMPELARQKIEVGERESLVDFSLHAGMMTSEEHLRRMPELAEMGILSFKAFTTKPFLASYDYIEELLIRASELGGRIVVHSEDDQVIERGVHRVRDVEGRKDPLAHHDSRPPEAEVVAVSRIIESVARVGGHYHVAHLNTARGAELVAHAKARGLRVTSETCVHYLVFTKDDVKRWGPYLKMTPPLRTKEDVRGLWEALLTGGVDMIATDHAPGTREEKEVGWDDIWEAWGGIPGVETLLPVSMSEGLRRWGIPPTVLCAALCANPAKAFGMYPRKGELAPRSDADLVIYDQNLEVEIRADRLHYKVGWTPYEGIVVRGWPVLVTVRGEVVAQDGEPVGRPGHGEFVRMGRWR